jgi:hypothetical protein
LCHFDDHQFTPFTSKDGLIDNTVLPSGVEVEVVEVDREYKIVYFRI